MNHNIDLHQLFLNIYNWLNNKLNSEQILLQIFISVILLFCTLILSKYLNKILDLKISNLKSKNWIKLSLQKLTDIIFPISAVILFGFYIVISSAIGFKYNIANIIVNLMLAWAVINVATSLFGKSFLIKWIKTLTIIIIALNIVGLLDITISFLDNLSFSIGETRISIYTILKGIILFTILLWITIIISQSLEKKINKISDLTPSLKVLFSKCIKIFLYIITILIALNAVGLDLTAFTIFGGAIGVGLGFGLQKVVSNFISGIILLTDRSIKPGDVIAIGETYGWVNSLGARYVSVITRDGKEHLIPNESLITEKVENWSFTNNDIRIRIPIGVSYNENIKQVIKIILNAVNSSDRVLKEPAPKCLLQGFGDSSVNLELRIWINDPVNGMGNIKSEVLLNIWEAFQEHNIQIPYPQRDIHIKTNLTKNVEFST